MEEYEFMNNVWKDGTMPMEEYEFISNVWKDGIFSMSCNSFSHCRRGLSGSITLSKTTWNPANTPPKTTKSSSAPAAQELSAQLKFALWSLSELTPV
jgi:hypothetical protein